MDSTRESIAEADRKRWRSLLEKATPGPWFGFDDDGEAYICPPATGAFLADTRDTWEQQMANARFISEAPTAIAALLAENDALRAELA